MKLKLITTFYINNVSETKSETLELKPDDGIEWNVVNIYPQMEYQTFEGFGGAVTEASAYVYSLMGENDKKKLLDAYFGKNGHRYRIVRTHIDSCDFSLSQYEAMSDKNDTGMKTFSLARDEKYIIPLLQDLKEVAGNDLEILLSPWSPPAFMKTNGNRCFGGSLLPEYRQFWANYICRYIKEYRRRGLSVTMVTIQNEANAKQIWDSCLYTPEEEKIFLRDYLYPTLAENGLDDVQILIWDHNKERMFERASAIIDEETNKMVSGVAFHWYTGDHFDAISLVREKYPDKKLIHTEGCVEYSRFGDEGQLKYAQMYAHDIIGNLNAGMNQFIDWNILLDHQGGPNHVKNYCNAPIMYDPENDVAKINLSFTYIGHFSRYIQPGAKRIAKTAYTDKCEVVAMKNPDDTIVAVFLNRTEDDLPVTLRIEGMAAGFVLKGNTISTAIIEK